MRFIYVLFFIILIPFYMVLILAINYSRTNKYLDYLERMPMGFKISKEERVRRRARTKKMNAKDEPDGPGRSIGNAM